MIILKSGWILRAPIKARGVCAVPWGFGDDERPAAFRVTAARTSGIDLHPNGNDALDFWFAIHIT
jgi:hypothetical protein